MDSKSVHYILKSVIDVECFFRKPCWLDDNRFVVIRLKLSATFRYSQLRIIHSYSTFHCRTITTATYYPEKANPASVGSNWPSGLPLSFTLHFWVCTDCCYYDDMVMTPCQ